MEMNILLLLGVGSERAAVHIERAPLLSYHAHRLCKTSW